MSPRRSASMYCADTGTSVFYQTWRQISSLSYKRKADRQQHLKEGVLVAGRLAILDARPGVAAQALHRHSQERSASKTGSCRSDQSGRYEDLLPSLPLAGHFPLRRIVAYPYVRRVRYTLHTRHGAAVTLCSLGKLVL